MAAEERDLVILGGGPAGYVAAIRARQLGGRVALVERDTLGGTCLNRGCIPARALVRGVEFLDLARRARDYGVNLEVAEVNLSRMMARKDTIIRTVVGGVELLMRENGVEVIRGEGQLLSPSVVEVKLGDGTSRQMTARRIILATGAVPEKPPVPGGPETITTDQALCFTEVPRSLVVLGAGPVGFALAGIFSRLGASLAVIEESTEILPGIDREITSLFEREMKKQKIQLHTGAKIQRIEKGPGDERTIVLTVEGVEIILTAQYVVVAGGRKPNVTGLGLDKVGVRIAEGAVVVDGKMQTSVPGIYAAGDVTGEPMLAHVAFAEGRVAVENALGKGAEIDHVAVPRCLYTAPEIASVGLTETEALARGYQVRVGRFPFAANGMATILAERTGMVKLISEARYGQILGVHIIGPHAADLIPEAALAMKLDATPQEIGAIIYPHPSLAEALMEAALDVTGETLHFRSPNR